MVSWLPAAISRFTVRGRKWKILLVAGSLAIMARFAYYHDLDVLRLRVRAQADPQNVSEPSQTHQTVSLQPTAISDESIHFIETSGDPNFHLENICIMESAARYNPHKNVYIHVAGGKLNASAAVQSLLGSQPNVHFVPLDVKMLINKAAENFGVILRNDLLKDLFDSQYKVTVKAKLS